MSTIESMESAVREFAESGYVVFRDAISAGDVSALWDDVERNIRENPDLTYAMHGEILKNKDIAGKLIQNDTVLRIIDMEHHSEITRDFMLHPVVSRFLSAYYEEPPTAIQTLTYKFSSQQGAHSDMYLVSPPPVGANYHRETLAAAWFACERSDEQNGALVIYPGSHKYLKKPLSSFGNNYGEWVQYLDEFCKSKGCHPKVFTAERGDLLIWHGDLVHAGGPILKPGQTRKSLVVHYCRAASDATPAVPDLEKVRHANGWYFRLRR